MRCLVDFRERCPKNVWISRAGNPWLKKYKVIESLIKGIETSLLMICEAFCRIF